MANQDLSGRHAARARRDAQVNGKAAQSAKSTATPARRTSRSQAAAAAATSSPAVVEAMPVAHTSSPAPVARNINVVTNNSSRDASRARRLAMSAKGKSGAKSSDRQRQEDARRKERVAAATKKDCGCGCDGSGDCGGANKAQAIAPTFVAPKATASNRRNEVKVVSASSTGRINSKLRRQAMSVHGKTGADSFRAGVSSAQMARQQNPDISGRELARTVRTRRSSGGAAAEGGSRSAPVGRRRPAKPADEVSGTQVSHSEKTTGDETGLCRSVTGTDYFSSDVFMDFCQGEAPAVPSKVKTSESLSGGTITASGKVGRSSKVSGDERGSCRVVTGTEYVGREQFDDFCNTKPEPGSAKVSFSHTTRGQIISGSKPARARQVSGNEAGTCKAVTGTPYAGMEQFEEYCNPAETRLAEARNQRNTAGNAGQDVTGMQPGFEGLTGASKGACSSVSGTAYVGVEQQQEVCGAMPAQISEPDFPKPLADAPWGAFSVLSAPTHASQPVAAVAESVTGSRYEQQGRVSGTFSLGEGKVTGTEQFRFGDRARARVENVAPTAVAAPTPVVKRVTGEGNDSGLKITGNDWDRGDHVTGTEGASAVKRNPTRRGPISAMPMADQKRNEEVERGSSNVTGGTGGTVETGAPITLSGGARG